MIEVRARCGLNAATNRLFCLAMATSCGQGQKHPSFDTDPPGVCARPARLDLGGTMVLDQWEGADPTDIAARSDERDLVHVAYQRLGLQQYATWNGSTLTTEQISLRDGAFVFLAPRIAVTTGGAPSILYAAGLGDNISYRVATLREGEFVEQVIDPDVGGSAVIGPAFAARGGTLAAVWRSEDGLKYAARNGTDWVHETLPRDTLSPVGLSLSLSSSGVRHIAFVAANAAQVQYAWSTQSDKRWTFEIIAQRLTSSPIQTDLVSTDDGTVHLAFAVGGLMYGRRANGRWDYEVAESAAPGASPTIAVDACGNVVILHQNSNTLEMMLTAKLNGVWESHVIAVLPGAVSTQGGLAITSQGHVSAFWYELDRGPREGPQGPGTNRIHVATASIKNVAE